MAYPYRQAWLRYQQDKNLRELIGGFARTYATAPQYAELAEGIAVQPNILNKVVTAANATPATA
jgi:hypothetical protein